MNYIAHSVFSLDDDKELIGNIFGDFFKGKIENIEIEDSVKKGIILHRRLDELSDSSIYHKNITKLLKPAYARYSSVIVDIIFDHFLAKNFEEFIDVKFDEYILELEKRIDKNKKDVPIEANFLFDHIVNDNFLYRYLNLDNTLKRIFYFTHRFSKRVDHELGEQIIIDNYEIIDNKFICFFKEINIKVKAD